MNNSKPTRFFTWSDVLQSCTDPETFSFPDADPSGLFIYGDDKNAIQKELSQKLGLAYDEEKNSVTLEGTSTTPRQLPVEILPKDDAPDVSPPRRPLWGTSKNRAKPSSKLPSHHEKVSPGAGFVWTSQLCQGRGRQFFEVPSGRVAKLTERMRQSRQQKKAIPKLLPSSPSKAVWDAPRPALQQPFVCSVPSLRPRCSMWMPMWRPLGSPG